MVLMSHIREASKVTVNSSYFHPAHQHYTDEAHKAETVPSVVIAPCTCITISINSSFPLNVQPVFN